MIKNFGRRATSLLTVGVRVVVFAATMGLGVAVTVLGLVILAPSQSSSAVAATTRTVAAYGGGAGAITTYQYPNGDSTQVYDSSGPVMVTAAPADDGPPPTTDSDTYTSGGTIASDNDSSISTSKSVTPVTAPSAATIVQQMGADAATVADFAAHDDADPSRSGTTTAASHGTLRAKTCVGKFSDSKKVHFYGCWNQYLVRRRGLDWHLVDHFWSSLTVQDGTGIFDDKITGLMQGVTYPRGNTIENYSPKQNVPYKGSCVAKTVSIGYDSTFFSDSYKGCAAYSGLHFVGKTHFQTKWDGQGDGPKDGARTTDGFDEVHNPADASAARPRVFQYWWK